MPTFQQTVYELNDALVELAAQNSHVVLFLGSLTIEKCLLTVNVQAGICNQLFSVY
jgi:hypothetical protein